jgi:serine/threonine protein kinase
MAERTDQVGQRFGDYWLRRRLGGGGFGDVYLGEHVQTKSLVAVKVLHIRLTRSEDLRAFINEVRTFRLQHPHIVRVLDVGIASDETPFLVMEYAPNGTLRDRHPKGTRLLLSTVLAYVVPLASALQYAHDLHLVHRDIKPENMLLGAGEVLWLSDFGIATVAHSTGSLTTEGMGGTLPYMAPEQIQGRPRPQSDQYALAIVVYEWLTGTWPFRGTPIEIAMQQQMTPPPALRTQVPTLPPEIEQVVLTALSKNPKERFGTIQAFATALVQAARPPLNTSKAGRRLRQPKQSGSRPAPPL